MQIMVCITHKSGFPAQQGNQGKVKEFDLFVQDVCPQKEVILRLLFFSRSGAIRAQRD